MTCPACLCPATAHGPYGCEAETGWPARPCECAVTDVATAIAEWGTAPAGAEGRAA